MRVKATREGLIGNVTATGWVIDAEFPFVALPSHRALGKWVTVANPLNGKWLCCMVRDVGPFNTHDDAYVFDGARPQAESGVSVSGKGTNGAGIDLGKFPWDFLGMEDNTEVDWQFVEPPLPDKSDILYTDTAIRLPVPPPLGGAL